MSATSTHDFFAELAKGHSYQAEIARRLRLLGLWVESDEEVDYRPVTEQGAEHPGSWDIRAGISPESFTYIAVKSHDYSFGPHGRGFIFPTIFIGPVTHWEAAARKGVTPSATVNISQHTNQAFWVPTFTSDHWRVRTIFDKRRGTRETNFAAPERTWCHWKTLAPLIRSGALADPEPPTRR